jgi:hypothetical protein
MLPLIPKSVKMESEVSVRLKENAHLIGYSENQLMVESFKGMLDLVDDNSNALPRIVVLIRSAKYHQAAPTHIGEAFSSSPRLRRWWGS